jgi:hypothetical protein
MGHQNAAYQIITELYTPETIMQDGTLRNILKWYIHFDIYVSVLSGAPSIISAQWLEEQHKFYVHQVQECPENISLRYEKHHSWIRLVGNNIGELFRRKMNGTITDAEFETLSSSLKRQLDDWEENLDPELVDSSKLVTNYETTAVMGPDDIVDPYQPGTIYSGNLFATNILILNFISLKNMFQTRLASLGGTPQPEETKFELAYRIAKIVDTVQYWRGSPPGALVGLRANFGLAVLLLPSGEKEIKWARKKFALIESHG